MDQFVSRLKELPLYCEFHDVNRELKSQIEYGTASKSLRRYAFHKPDLTLDELILYGRIQEQSELHAKEIEDFTAADPKTSNGRHTVQKLKFCRKSQFMPPKSCKKPNSRKVVPSQFSSEFKKKKCYKCGHLDFPHKGSCPADGKSCMKCSKPNHSAAICHSRS